MSRDYRDDADRGDDDRDAGDDELARIVIILALHGFQVSEAPAPVNTRRRFPASPRSPE
ncbi:hypothetical protein [Variovorax rhizosphaerae]|uniref:Uncharacterized protein n=1 Tax=Variovorax rhizosphaerae TaxID=1836200 RepID=A0ABU8WSS9_9BURK